MVFAVFLEKFLQQEKGEQTHAYGSIDEQSGSAGGAAHDPTGKENGDNKGYDGKEGGFHVGNPDFSGKKQGSFIVLTLHKGIMLWSAVQSSKK